MQNKADTPRSWLSSLVGIMLLISFSRVAQAEDISFVTPTSWSLQQLADVDGDGRSEIIWSSPSAIAASAIDYHIMFLDEHGVPRSNTALTPVSDRWTLAGARDFDGNTTDDLLWHNPLAGRTGIYLMDGAHATWRPIRLPNGDPAIMDPAFTVAALGDLEDDGEVDILWRPPGTGSTSAWNVSVDDAGAMLTEVKTIGSGPSSQCWKLISASDAGGDGKDDLIWWSACSGVGWLYEMNGAAIMNSVRIDPPRSADFPDEPDSTSWTMVAAGDFNGDKRADALWKSDQHAIWRLTILDHGNLLRYEHYKSNHPGLGHAGQAVSVGDIDGDGLADIALAAASETPATVHRFLRPIRGAAFFPETFRTSNGAELKNGWIQHYLSDPGVRSQANDEFGAIRQVAGLTHVMIHIQAGKDLNWPLATDSQLDVLAAILDDVAANDLKLILFMNTWCQLTEEQVMIAQQLGDLDTEKGNHVGGHCAGEYVNNRRLHWDCAPCVEYWPFPCGSTPPSSPGDNIDRVIRYYTEILDGLDQRLVDKDVVEYLMLTGNPFVPFGAETNLFHPDTAQYIKDDVAAFFREVMPDIRAVTDWPVGIHLQVGNMRQGPLYLDYDFMEEWLNVLPLEGVDLIDITIPAFVDEEALLEMVPRSQRHKIVFSDLKAKFHDGIPSSGVSDPDDVEMLPLAGVMLKAIKKTHAAGVRGWWMWPYKDYSPASPNPPLREYSGVPGQTNGNNNVGWDEDALEVIWGDLGFRDR